MNKIYRVEFSDSDPMPAVLERKLGKLELVAHRDENGVIFECAPPPEGYHVETHEESAWIGTACFAIRDGLTMADNGGYNGEFYFPPRNSYVWRKGVWELAVTSEEYEDFLEDTQAPS